MARQLKKSAKIWKLAQDLGIRIRTIDDPVSAILDYCEKIIKQFLKDFPDCKNLYSMLDWVAGKVGTTFEEIHSDKDLERIKSKYLKKGEKIFVTLDKDLSDNVYGITFKLTNREPWEPPFVSIIDCRGRKAFRSYYTKWHEIAHLLILTDQMRLSFTRTYHLSDKDPEEVMIDIIAGTFGFYPPIIRQYINSEISFECIDDLRKLLCPEASQQASLIGFVKAWPSPCLLIYGELALKKSEKERLSQQNFDFYNNPSYVLRATKVTINEEALRQNLRIFENMRIPKNSVIHRVFEESSTYGEAEENLSWWETSDGMRLPNLPIRVQAKNFGDGVYALITPIKAPKNCKRID